MYSCLWYTSLFDTSVCDLHLFVRFTDYDVHLSMTWYINDTPVYDVHLSMTWYINDTPVYDVHLSMTWYINDTPVYDVHLLMTYIHQWYNCIWCTLFYDMIHQWYTCIWCTPFYHTHPSMIHLYIIWSSLWCRFVCVHKSVMFKLSMVNTCLSLHLLSGTISKNNKNLFESTSTSQGPSK